MTRVSIGTDHMCVVRSTGRVQCWGSNSSGQLVNGSLVASMTPVTVADLEDAIDVSVGFAHTCALRANGIVVCWGLGSYGQLGDGQYVNAVYAIPVTGINDAVQLECCRERRVRGPSRRNRLASYTS